MKVYIGEATTLNIDLAASLTDPDYDLATASLLARVARPGSSAALFEVAGTVVDTADGTFSVTLQATDTEDLDEGDWTVQVIDTDSALMLYEFGFEAAYRITAVADQVARGVLRLPYSAYLEAGGSDIPGSSWDKYAAQSARVVKDATMGRAEVSFDDHEDALTEAVLRVAEALYAADTGIVSESLAGYSYTVADAPTRRDAYAVAVMALGGTGLTYRGL